MTAAYADTPISAASHGSQVGKATSVVTYTLAEASGKQLGDAVVRLRRRGGQPLRELPGHRRPVHLPEHVLVTEENNGQSPAVLIASKGDTVSSINSLEVGGTVGVNVLAIVNASVTAKYGHTWAESRTFTTGVSNRLLAGYYGEITAIAPMVRDTGNFTITMGDITWNLTRAYLDAPNQDGAEHVGYHTSR